MLSLKGIPSPEVMEKVDKVKKEIIACVYKPWKFLWLDRFELLEQLRFPIEITQSSREISLFVGRCTKSFWGVIAMYVIGCDMAYRLRIQDMLNEANKWDLVDDPHRELNRLWAIYERREQVIPTYMLPKSRKVFNLIYWALYIPKFRRSFEDACRRADWDKFKFTDEDKEWISVREDYKFYE